MSAKPTHYASLGIAVLGHYGILVATGIPYWKQSSWQVSDPLYGRIPTFDGIWWQCMSLKDGGFTCNNYGMPTLFVEAGIQACRGLMVVACLLSFFGLIINMLVLDCSSLVANGTKTKRTLAIVAGLCLLTSALCTLGATVYYAWQVTYQFYNPYYQEKEFKYEYGACLYTAWVSMALLIVAGSILTFGSCRNNRDNFEPYNYRGRTRIPSYDKDISNNRTEYV